MSRSLELTWCRLLLVAFVVCLTAFGCQRQLEYGDSATSVVELTRLGKLSDPREVEQFVSALNDADRHALRQRVEKFEQVPREELRRLRRLHVAIAKHELGDQLYDTLVEYHDWLGTLSSSERADLLAMSPKQRVVKIGELRQSQITEAFRLMAGNLESQDAMVLARWLNEYVRRHEKEIVPQLSELVQTRLKNIPNARNRGKMLMLHMARNQQVVLPPPTPDELDRLVRNLSDAGYEQIAQRVDFDHPDEAVSQLIDTMTRTMRRRFQAMGADRMTRFYEEELTPEQRQSIDAMPPDEAQAEMRYLFMQSMMERRKPDAMGPPGQRGNRPGRRRRTSGLGAGT